MTVVKSENHKATDFAGLYRLFSRFGCRVWWSKKRRETTRLRPQLLHSNQQLSIAVCHLFLDVDLRLGFLRYRFSSSTDRFHRKKNIRDAVDKKQTSWRHWDRFWWLSRAGRLWQAEIITLMRESYYKFSGKATYKCIIHIYRVTQKSKPLSYLSLNLIENHKKSGFLKSNFSVEEALEDYKLVLNILYVT